MVRKPRYWKEKDGRFFARVAVPMRLRPHLDRPRSELIEALGSDRRTALRLHSSAVAQLQHEIALAEKRANAATSASSYVSSSLPLLTTADFGHAVWERYKKALEADDTKREHFPSSSMIAIERKKLEKQ